MFTLAKSFLNPIVGESQNLITFEALTGESLPN